MGVADQRVTDEYAAYRGDCTEVMASLPTGSIHGSVYSLPFARPGGTNPGMYHYTSDDRDLSNSRSYEEFLAHYGFVVAEVARVTMPGRVLGQWDKKPGQPGYVPAVVPYRESRDDEDEQHVHPLQLDVPRRFVYRQAVKNLEAVGTDHAEPEALFDVEAS
jgi:hypothetical protein